MKLITELNTDTQGVIVESVGGTKQYFFEGIFVQADVKNRNGRIYPLKMMEEEVNRYINEKINTNSAVGELGHPTTPTINYERASHKHIQLVQEGSNWIGKARVLTELPYGKIVKGLIEEGVRFGTSTRGIGGLKQTNGITEVYNYKIATVGDVVSDPSGPDCFVRGVMEGAEFIYDAISDSYVAQNVVEDIRKEFDKPKRLIDEGAAIIQFERFLQTLGSR